MREELPSVSNEDWKSELLKPCKDAQRGQPTSITNRRRMNIGDSHERSE